MCALDWQTSRNSSDFIKHQHPAYCPPHSVTVSASASHQVAESSLQRPDLNANATCQSSDGSGVNDAFLRCCWAAVLPVRHAYCGFKSEKRNPTGINWKPTPQDWRAVPNHISGGCVSRLLLTRRALDEASTINLVLNTPTARNGKYLNVLKPCVVFPYFAIAEQELVLFCERQ
jgi:hypothetical protein